MADEPRQVNFTIVPAEPAGMERTYANFCGVSHTPFDFTLTFCEVQPLSEQDIQRAQQEQPAELLCPRGHRHQREGGVSL